MLRVRKVRSVARTVVEVEAVGMGVKQVSGVQDNRHLDEVNIGGHVMVGWRSHSDEHLHGAQGDHHDGWCHHGAKWR